MRIEVEPDALIGAGQRMGSLGSQLGQLSDALGAALGSGIASGMDPAGMNFGLKYGRQAEEFAKATANAANAFKGVGYMMEATGYNYKNADAGSTIGGQGPSGGLGGEPSKTTAGDVPAGPNSSMVPPPQKWNLIQPFLNLIPGLGTFAGLAMTWPSGNSALMRVTAAQWRNLGQGLSVFDGAMTEIKAAASNQHIPEAAKIGEALTALGDAVSSMAQVSSTVAQSVDDFASGVQETQDAIRRLLDRISLDGLWDTVKGIFTGEADDILKEVAHDVGAVLGNFQDQIKGIVGLLEELTILIGDAATTFEKWIRPVLEAQFGDDVGGVLADAVTWYTDVQVGAATGLINTVSGVVALADPDTWKGMADVALSVARDPTTLPGVLANMGKQFVAWDKWSGDHPGRAAGEAAFNIGMLFVPGGALSKSGSVAKGLGYTSRLLEEGRFPRLSDVPGLGGLTRGAPELDGVPGAGAGLPGVSEVRPGSVPGSLVGPSGPNAIDPPTSPASVGNPGGSPGPNSGGGPAPTSSGPSGSPSGPGPGAGDSPSSSASQGSSESSAPSQASGSGSGSGDGASPAAGNGAGPASSEPGTSPTGQDPTGPASDRGHTEEHGHDPDDGRRHGSGGGGDEPGRPSDTTDAPNNPPHTGLHDPPANHGIAGDRLPDLSSVNGEYRLADGSVDPDRFDEWTRAVSDAYPTIGDDGVAGVYDYTTENYQGMNPYLRDIDPLSPEHQSVLGADSISHMTDEQRSSWEQRISDTDDGLAALPPYRADPADAMSTTWRGMHASDELLAQLNVGDHFEDAAYISTSLDSKVAEDFALSADPSKTPTLLSVEGYDGVDVAQVSRYTDEAEILFPRGSTFEVISRDVDDDGLIRIVLRQIQP